MITVIINALACIGALFLVSLLFVSIWSAYGEYRYTKARDARTTTNWFDETYDQQINETLSREEQYDRILKEIYNPECADGNGDPSFMPKIQRMTSELSADRQAD